MCVHMSTWCVRVWVYVSVQACKLCACVLGGCVSVYVCGLGCVSMYSSIGVCVFVCEREKIFQVTELSSELPENRCQRIQMKNFFFH